MSTTPATRRDTLATLCGDSDSLRNKIEDLEQAHRDLLIVVLSDKRPGPEIATSLVCQFNPEKHVDETAVLSLLIRIELAQQMA